jgi:membrane-associated phospholipid phosphatase
MPFAVLVLAGSLAALAVGLLARRWAPVRTAVPAEPALAHAGAREAAREHPEAATGLALGLGLALVLAGGVVLAALAIAVRSGDALASIDGGAARWAHRHATDWSTQGLRVVTAFGETWMAILVAVLVAAADAVRRRTPWTAAFLLAAIGGDKLLTQLIKLLVDRVRPDLVPEAATLGPSFPSGHSSTAAVLWSAVAIVLAGRLGRRAVVPLAAGAAGIAVAVAASRVLLDVHWVSDVLAGLALGWGWCAACAVAFGWTARRRRVASARRPGDRGFAIGRPGKPDRPWPGSP